ncbi:Type I secretion system membrane fusion protein PrsE [Methylobacterium adhaesivum]|uniref:Membrane fusion protein (MFP) family protein n=1 Tax=Methylobacterium adhaesivum TaxID=333297 RepID=A0ABT8BGJ2_9HYPH|nr:HlyD family type I secretion periplasmic adaptor subunit [Methylobacterium adhaesivum]MDN3590391.1 HlyD family type I secretion periplasmic adaptor subunit [Methylobacterium adhaesivum]GJD32380.1 Type I secretion system membrane fusion protein PrsE [Methylobacterium adhaesivum]
MTLASPVLTPSRPFDADRSIGAHLLGVSAVLSVLVFGIGGWATFTPIHGAVMASGQLVVESDVKKVQHPTGGVVGAIRVQDGSRVSAGDILITLDETQIRANLDIVLKAMDELSARRARNEAERDGASAIAFPPDLVGRQPSDPVVAQLLDGETRLFETRLSGRDGQKAQLAQRVLQIRDEITGLTEQVAAKAREIALIGDELVGIRELWARNLVPLSRVTALERDAARIQGERGQLVAAQAQARGKITEIELQILQVDQDMRGETGKELADIRGRWSELAEKRVAALDQLKRTDLRAPQSGVVHQMTVHTVGGLVVPSEPAMLIVPDADTLAVEVRIQPQEIDNVHLDQDVVLRFPAFNQRVTPEIDGLVTRVSADVTQDVKTGQSYYTARIRVPEGQRERLGGVRLVPGMPVEAYIQTGERSVLSYLVKPLADQIAKAWRER